jgi:hypothetical protein
MHGWLKVGPLSLVNFRIKGMWRFDGWATVLSLSLSLSLTEEEETRCVGSRMAMEMGKGKE